MAPAIDERHRHQRLEQHFTLASHLLLKLHTGACHGDETGFNCQHIVEPGGTQEIANHAPHHEQGVSQLAVVNIEKPQAIAAPALSELQIVGVIDNPARIRILIINTDRKDMDFSSDPPCQLRHRCHQAPAPLG